MSSVLKIKLKHDFTSLETLSTQLNGTGLLPVVPVLHAKMNQSRILSLLKEDSVIKTSLLHSLYLVVFFGGVALIGNMCADCELAYTQTSGYQLKTM